MGIDFSGTEIELTIPGSTAYATSTFSAVSGYPERVKSQVISVAHAHLHYCFQRLSTDNGPLYRFHQRLANFRLQKVTEIKTGALCAFIPSVCRAAHRNLTPRMPGPHVILDRHRPAIMRIRFRRVLLALADGPSHRARPQSR